MHKVQPYINEYLVVAIIISVVIVILDSVKPIHVAYGDLLALGDLIFTILFSIEYGVRIFYAKHKLKYILSFYGLIDLAAILPYYLIIFIPELIPTLDLRILRLVRIVRILKLLRFMHDMSMLAIAFERSRYRLLIFLITLFMISTIVGSVMYTIEGPKHGYYNIPTGIYWAVVTITTVGYGDITPHTPLGQIISVLMMLLGYATIAVPVSIFSAELTAAMGRRQRKKCPECGRKGHESIATYCMFCGTKLD